MRTHAKVRVLATILFCPLATIAPRAYAQGGVPLWTNTFRGVAGRSTIALDDDKVVVVAPVGGTNVSGQTFEIDTLVAYSKDGALMWTNLSHGNLVAIDAAGDVVVAGSSPGSTYRDFFTAKYSSSGLPIWTNYYAGPAPGDDSVWALAVDDPGNVFVTGPSWGGANPHYATIKYSSAGVPLWTNRYHHPGNGWDNPVAVAVDKNGDVIVTGTAIATGPPNSTTSKYATIKYTSAGVALWTNFYNGGAFSEAKAMALDPEGNVFVTGYTRASGNGGILDDDFATVAYASNGFPLWTNRYNGPADYGDEPSGIAVDKTGNVFVTGFSDNPVENSIWSDYTTIKYSNSAVPLWVNNYDGPANRVDWAQGVAVDSAGNVFVTGFSEDYYDLPVYRMDFATFAYSSAGDLLWQSRYNTPASLSSSATGIAVDSAGNVFVTGYSVADGYVEYTTIKYFSSLPPPIHLDFQVQNNQLVLTWTNADFSLQAAPSLSSTFTNVPNATSPYTNSLTAPQQFFRLLKN